MKEEGAKTPLFSNSENISQKGDCPAWAEQKYLQVQCEGNALHKSYSRDKVQWSFPVCLCTSRQRSLFPAEQGARPGARNWHHLNEQIHRINGRKLQWSGQNMPVDNVRGNLSRGPPPFHTSLLPIHSSQPRNCARPHLCYCLTVGAAGDLLCEAGCNLVLNQLSLEGLCRQTVVRLLVLCLARAWGRPVRIPRVNPAWRSRVRGHSGSHAITAEHWVHVSGSQEVRRCSLLAIARSHLTYAVTGHFFLGRRWKFKGTVPFLLQK